MEEHLATHKKVRDASSITYLELLDASVEEVEHKKENGHSGE